MWVVLLALVVITGIALAVSPWLLGVIAFLAIFVVASSFIRTPKNKAALLTVRFPFFFGTLPAGRIIAKEGEQGLQASVWGPGQWYWKWLVDLFTRQEFINLIQVKETEVGIVEALDGATRLQGQAFAKPLASIDFSDGEKFLRNNGERGVQLETLNPGLHAMNAKTVKPPGQEDPEEDKVRLFRVKIADRTDILPAIVDDPYNPGQRTKEPWPRIGIVTTLVGEYVPEKVRKRQIVSPHIDGHDNFQNLGGFVTGKGQQGLQEDVLEPGGWRINTEAVKVELVPAVRILPGWVGVEVASIGKEPKAKDFLTPAELGNRTPVQVLRPGIMNKSGTRGQALTERDYFINPYAVQVFLVPTAPQKICYHPGDHPDDNKPLVQYPSIPIETKEGFQLDLLAKVIVRVDPSDAPMITKLADARRREESVLVKLAQSTLHPIATDIAQRVASSFGILDFIMKKDKVASKVEVGQRDAMGPYYVRVERFAIDDLDFKKRGDKGLEEFLNQLNERAVAVQRELAEKANIPAEKARILRQAEKVTADNQEIPVRTALIAEALGLSSQEFQAQPWYVKVAVLALMDPEGIAKLLGRK